MLYWTGWDAHDGSAGRYIAHDDRARADYRPGTDAATRPYHRTRAEVRPFLDHGPARERDAGA